MTGNSTINRPADAPIAARSSDVDLSVHAVREDGVSHGALPKSAGSGRFWNWYSVSVEAIDAMTGRRRRMNNGKFLIPVGDYCVSINGITRTQQVIRDQHVFWAERLAAALNARLPSEVSEQSSLVA